ncbi:hypothetical protein SARC_07509 [Sphaeroforma arctica JP610]|uniref:Uncharacterized protein n=1 Tax=Sphaeroforma arctica JP610 TaxID=667725 RepID=A0A0L0FTK5_9EUKA|nr:hypothetical protein SARC_07509 [Sphaeroforma arctica JP610]KNC80122.1 hypothetical protein SARC_07509 [Sphaeroforma arctica JP610]|eukprot:XP_014154024.1 hypothetical protein SARC_07509 [Sphaeroforma arctica JP610]
MVYLHREKLKGTNGDMFVPWKMNADRQKIAQEQTAKGGVKRKASSTIEGKFQVFQRYYHLYAEGELCGLVESAGNMSVVEHGYERDNWWAVVKKL